MYREMTGVSVTGALNSRNTQSEFQVYVTLHMASDPQHKHPKQESNILCEKDWLLVTGVWSTWKCFSSVL